MLPYSSKVASLTTTIPSTIQPMVQQVRHKNLISFLQTIETNARVYLVMEYATKGCLLDLIRKVKKLSEKDAGLWFKQICDAVEYLHSRCVVWFFVEICCGAEIQWL